MWYFLSDSESDSTLTKGLVSVQYPPGFIFIIVWAVPRSFNSTIEFNNEISEHLPFQNSPRFIGDMILNKFDRPIAHPFGKIRRMFLGGYVVQTIAPCTQK